MKKVFWILTVVWLTLVLGKLENRENVAGITIITKTYRNEKEEATLLNSTIKSDKHNEIKNLIKERNQASLNSKFTRHQPVKRFVRKQNNNFTNIMEKWKQNIASLIEENSNKNQYKTSMIILNRSKDYNSLKETYNRQGKIEKTKKITSIEAANNNNKKCNKEKLEKLTLENQNKQQKTSIKQLRTMNKKEDLNVERYVININNKKKEHIGAGTEQEIKLEEKKEKEDKMYLEIEKVLKSLVEKQKNSKNMITVEKPLSIVLNQELNKNAYKLFTREIKNYLHKNVTFSSQDQNEYKIIEQIEHCANELHQSHSCNAFNSPIRKGSITIFSPSFQYLSFVVELLYLLRIVSDIEIKLQRFITFCLKEKEVPTTEFETLINHSFTKYLEMMAKNAGINLNKLKTLVSEKELEEATKDEIILQKQINRITELCEFVGNELTKAVKEDNDEIDVFMENNEEHQEIANHYINDYKQIETYFTEIFQTFEKNKDFLKLTQRLEAMLEKIFDGIQLKSYEIDILVDFNEEQSEGMFLDREETEVYYSQLQNAIMTLKSELRQQKNLIQKINRQIDKIEGLYCRPIKKILQECNEFIYSNVKNIDQLEVSCQVLRVRLDHN